MYCSGIHLYHTGLPNLVSRVSIIDKEALGTRLRLAVGERLCCFQPSFYCVELSLKEVPKNTRWWGLARLKQLSMAADGCAHACRDGHTGPTPRQNECACSASNTFDSFDSSFWALCVSVYSAVKEKFYWTFWWSRSHAQHRLDRKTKQ